MKLLFPSYVKNDFNKLLDDYGASYTTVDTTKTQVAYFIDLSPLRADIRFCLLRTIQEQIEIWLKDFGVARRSTIVEVKKGKENNVQWR